MTTDEQAEAILDACPDTDWRLLFALARYGGLRVPSEALGLKWTDIDWANGRFVVSSPKTEHHQGHESREVLLFPELLPHLREAFEQAEPGAEFCITRYRDQKVNLRTRLLWIIKRAGLKPWPKLWQNLRSTRETELADQFPAHVASAWIGNSVAVAVKHYLQVTEDHFKQAAKKATQNPTSKAHESSRNDSKTQMPSESLKSVSSSAYERLQPIATSRSSLEIQRMGDTGLELYPYSPRNTQILDQAAQNAAHLRSHQGSAIAIWLT